MKSIGGNYSIGVINDKLEILEDFNVVNSNKGDYAC